MMLSHNPRLGRRHSHSENDGKPKGFVRTRFSAVACLFVALAVLLPLAQTEVAQAQAVSMVNVTLMSNKNPPFAPVAATVNMSYPPLTHFLGPYTWKATVINLTTGKVVATKIIINQKTSAQTVVTLTAPGNYAALVSVSALRPTDGKVGFVAGGLSPTLTVIGFMFPPPMP